MKKYFFVVALLVATVQGLNAQDMIVTNEGETIKVYNLEVAPSFVYYTISPEDNSTVKKISKSEILIIKLADGRKIDPNENEIIPNSQTAAAIKPTYPADKDALNKAMVSSFNSACDEAKDILKTPKKAKKGFGFLMFFDASGQSVFTDGLVTIELRSGRKNGKNFYPLSDEWFYANIAAFKIVIRNNSQYPVYINLANCHISRNDLAEAIYTQTITSTTNVNSSSVGVAVLPGIGIGGGQATATSTTVVASQYVTIPAGSEYTTDEILLWKYNSDDRRFSSFDDPEKTGHVMFADPDLIPDFKERKIGEYIAYERVGSPLRIRADINL